MNQSKSKAAKKKIYGDYSPRFRKYTRNAKGIIEADEKRQFYQAMKRLYRDCAFEGV